ncbi:DJ-1/PfpI family protein [Corynebacterium sp. 3HC-13]|uniref:DJ-1/PfpI family protein n=1 Tax=Corynebacterium poyangense TaxID=2684405 RepID=UPI001CCE1BE8|nr:DJ-1/PfpI family protein [Corynebacterium poyangense]MBZ8177575.1 DJ-1/PfpI family protein [Corynebacterium poyangense]
MDAENHPAPPSHRVHSVGIVMFDGFELLDVFGPAELLSQYPNDFPITYVAETPGKVRSSQGIEVIATGSLAASEPPAIMLVPGGMGTRRLVTDQDFLTALTEWAQRTEIVSSVCTGSALLAAAGILEGHRATSNKAAFGWVSQHGDNVTWVPHARWVTDKNIWTSSGVAAGIDMTAALIAHLKGEEAARHAAKLIEL